MGKPPDRVLFKKLAAKYLKFYDTSTVSFRKTNLASEKLKDCFQDHGVGHKNCEKLVEELDKNHESDTNNYISYRKYISNYPEMLDKYSLSIKDPKRRKGRKTEPAFAHRTQGYGKDYPDNY